MYAQYFQGPFQETAVLELGPVAVGMTFWPIPTNRLPWTSGNFPGTIPFGTIATGQTFPNIGAIPSYTVTAVLPDPFGGSTCQGQYPGDQVTLSGGVGTISTSLLAGAYRVS